MFSLESVRDLLGLVQVFFEVFILPEAYFLLGQFVEAFRLHHIDPFLFFFIDYFSNLSVQLGNVGRHGIGPRFTFRDLILFRLRRNVSLRGISIERRCLFGRFGVALISQCLLRLDHELFRLYAEKDRFLYIAFLDSYGRMFQKGLGIPHIHTLLHQGSKFMFNVFDSLLNAFAGPSMSIRVMLIVGHDQHIFVS